MGRSLDHASQVASGQRCGYTLRMRHAIALSAALLASTGSVALADALVVEPTSPNLVPGTFEYRYDSTRTWLLGCFGYDWLHGGGFYPKSWSHSAAFTPADGDYRAAFQPTWLERFCAAEMGIYNYVLVTWTDPANPVNTYRGVIQVDAGGTSKLGEVSCRLVDPASPSDAVQCERAVVDLSSPGDTYLIVHVD